MKCPVWVTVVAVAAALPAAVLMPLSFVRLVSGYPALIKLYPVYVVAGCWLARSCWPQRKELFWILIILVLLSHLAVLWLYGFAGDR